MKFAFIADLHLSGFGNDPIDSVENLPLRIASIKRCLEFIILECKKRNINTLEIGGDLLNDKSLIYVVAQNLLLQFFRNHKDFKFIIIDGNHDVTDKGKYLKSGLECLDSESNVVRIKNSSFMNIEDKKIFHVPWTFGMFEDIKNNKADILISHFGLSEAVLSSGISVKSEISVKDLIGKYKLVLLGHYHKPQEMILPEISLYYSGSIIQKDWGEKGEEKRFLIIDTDNLSVESIPIEGYKKHYYFSLNEENKNEILKNALKLRDEGHYVKIESEENIDVVDNKGIIFIKNETSDLTNRGMSMNMSERERMEKYCKFKEVKNSDIEEFIQVGIEIIEKDIK